MAVNKQVTCPDTSSYLPSEPLGGASLKTPAVVFTGTHLHQLASYRILTSVLSFDSKPTFIYEAPSIPICSHYSSQEPTHPFPLPRPDSQHPSSLRAQIPGLQQKLLNADV